MSAIAFNAIASQTSVNQRFLTNPFRVLTRRGRLACTLVVLSLTVVMAAGFAAQSGAGYQITVAPTYVTLAVPRGATLWSVASAYAIGDVQAMVEEIREVNNLNGYDLMAGQKLRVPSK